MLSNPQFFSVLLRKSQLNFYNGNLSDEYYVTGEVPNSLDFTERQLVELKIRSGQLICLNGEPDLEKIVKGDFRKLDRPDCALKFNQVFRWAWESWRMVVGNRIGSIYPDAMEIMNVGARDKGELVDS